MIRKFTIRFRDNGIDLLKKLFEKGKYSFEEFSDWFKVSGVRKDQKSANVKLMIERLIGEDFIQYKPEEKMYYLSQNATIRAVELVNSGRIRSGSLYYLEKELLSSEYLYYF